MSINFNHLLPSHKKNKDELQQRIDQYPHFKKSLTRPQQVTLFAAIWGDTELFRSLASQCELKFEDYACFQAATHYGHADIIRIHLEQDQPDSNTLWRGYHLLIQGDDREAFEVLHPYISKNLISTLQILNECVTFQASSIAKYILEQTPEYVPSLHFLVDTFNQSTQDTRNCMEGLSSDIPQFLFDRLNADQKQEFLDYHQNALLPEAEKLLLTLVSQDRQAQLEQTTPFVFQRLAPPRF